MNYIIETFDLTKEFLSTKGFYEFLLHPLKRAKKTLALDQVNLKIPPGKIFSLLGPNGAGKTTLIKILCSLILPTRGKALVCGYDIVRKEKEVKSSVGLVTGEERSFYWRLTGRENLSFFATLYGLPPKITKQKIDFYSNFLSLKAHLDKRFQEYSTGIKQRLAIARSLLNTPQVLFFDEPTKSLDPGSAEELHQFISEKLVKEEGKTIFYTTHQLEEAERFSDYIGIMVKGQIRAFGTLEELQKNFHCLEGGLKKIYKHLVKEV